MRPLNIAILGYKPELSVKGFHQILQNNIEQIRNVSKIKKVARLNDGTTIETILWTDEFRLKGKRIDQLILFDDSRWEIQFRRWKEIELIKLVAMRETIIPEEFQIIKYEDMG